MAATKDETIAELLPSQGCAILVLRMGLKKYKILLGHKKGESKCLIVRRGKGKQNERQQRKAVQGCVTILFP